MAWFANSLDLNSTKNYSGNVFNGPSIRQDPLIAIQEGRDYFHAFFISYIFIDASGWVISDVSFGFMGDFGSCNPNDPVGIDLTPTPIPTANLRIHTRKKK